MKYYIWVILFFILAYLLPLGFRPMWASEEFSFAQISFDMINNSDYLLNEITNSRSFMTYYLTSLSMKLFGVNAFGIRFAATLSIGITAILIALLIRQLLHDKRLAALASAIYLSSFLVYFVGIYPLSDSIFTSFIFGATGTAFLAIVENSWTKRRVLMLILSGIALFAGFFTKGFLACFIWALPLVCFIILKKKWQDLLTLFYLPISIAALLVWLVGSLKYGPVYDFSNFILTIGNFNNLNFSSFNFSSFGYYLGGGVIAIMPGSLLGLLGLRNSLASQKELFGQDIYKFALISTFIPFLFYPFIREKSLFNILPSIAFFAIIVAGQVALYLRSGIHIKLFNYLLKSWGIIIAAIGFFAILSFPLVTYPGILKYFPSAKQCIFIIAITGLVAVCSGVSLLLNVQIENWRRQIMVFFGGIALVFLSFTSLIPAGADYRVMPEYMIKNLLGKINYQLSDNPNVTLVTFPKIASAVSFICNKKDVYSLENVNANKNDDKEKLALKKKNLLLSLNELEEKILQLKANERLLLIYWSTKDNYPAMPKVKYSYIYTAGFFALVIFDRKSKMEESEK